MKQLVIGMDIAKTGFQRHFVETNGEVKRLKLPRIIGQKCLPEWGKST
jgi:hypothetical protein